METLFLWEKNPLKTNYSCNRLSGVCLQISPSVACVVSRIHLKRVLNNRDKLGALSEWMGSKVTSFRAIVGLFLLLSHLSFMCYYVWIGREPHALALASLTAVGFYLHLLCFIAAVEFAYWSSTFVLRKLKGFSKRWLFFPNFDSYYWNYDSYWSHQT